jgi:hypothetical protein
MRDVLARYQSFGLNAASLSSNPIVEIDFSPRKFWMLSHIFVNGYCGLFRLHATKEMVC